MIRINFTIWSILLQKTNIFAPHKRGVDLLHIEIRNKIPSYRLLIQSIENDKS